MEHNGFIVVVGNGFGTPFGIFGPFSSFEEADIFQQKAQEEYCVARVEVLTTPENIEWYYSYC